jgi:hypothetical protein
MTDFTQYQIRVDELKNFYSKHKIAFEQIKPNKICVDLRSTIKMTEQNITRRNKKQLNGDPKRIESRDNYNKHDHQHLTNCIDQEFRWAKRIVNDYANDVAEEAKEQKREEIKAKQRARKEAKEAEEAEEAEEEEKQPDTPYNPFDVYEVKPPSPSPQVVNPFDDCELPPPNKHRDPTRSLMNHPFWEEAVSVTYVQNNEKWVSIREATLKKLVQTKTFKYKSHDIPDDYEAFFTRIIKDDTAHYFKTLQLGKRKYIWLSNEDKIEVSAKKKQRFNDYV